MKRTVIEIPELPDPLPNAWSPEQDWNDIWEKAIAEWCAVNWCGGMEKCRSVADAKAHLSKMMDQDFRERTDPTINGGYELVNTRAIIDPPQNNH